MRRTIIAAVAAVIVGAACAGAPDTDQGVPDPGVRPTAEATKAAPKGKAPKPPQQVFGAGTYEVGSEIKPGTYATKAGNGDFDLCTWSRLKDFEGQLSSITANGLVEAGAKGRLTVKKADKGVEFTGSCVWTAVK